MSGVSSRLEATKKLVCTKTGDRVAEKVARGVELLKKYLNDDTPSVEEIIDTLSFLCEQQPLDGYDILSGWRDGMKFYSPSQIDRKIEIFCAVCKDSRFTSHERLITAVMLYNAGEITVCYDCFVFIAGDDQASLDARVDSSRYLLASMNEEYRQKAQECILEVITDYEHYTSAKRYSVISTFVSKTGLRTFSNGVDTKLQVPYDEEFVKGLQWAFFNLPRDKNDPEETILSAQHLLQMVSITADEKVEIETLLLEMARDTSLRVNKRADAADVVLREGSTKEAKAAAREIIAELGLSAVDGKKVHGTLLERAATYANNSQNVHLFEGQLEEFVSQIVLETDEVPSFEYVYEQTGELIRKYTEMGENRFNALKALNRVSIDTARFTNMNVNLAEIFVHVFARISKYPPEIQTELYKRFVQELVDTGDTCSSGHAYRFVNVLSGYDVTLRIDWDQQIKANMAGRMNARIRDCPDEELRGVLAMATSDIASEEEKAIYVKFIQDSFADLRRELYEEFVTAGHVDAATFDKAFEGGTVGWM